MQAPAARALEIVKFAGTQRSKVPGWYVASLPRFQLQRARIGGPEAGVDGPTTPTTPTTLPAAADSEWQPEAVAAVDEADAAGAWIEIAERSTTLTPQQWWNVVHTWTTARSFLRCASIDGRHHIHIAAGARQRGYQYAGRHR